MIVIPFWLPYLISCGWLRLYFAKKKKKQNKKETERKMLVIVFESYLEHCDTHKFILLRTWNVWVIWNVWIVWKGTHEMCEWSGLMDYCFSISADTYAIFDFVGQAVAENDVVAVLLLLR